MDEFESKKRVDFLRREDLFDKGSIIGELESLQF
jgi:hypothetical protein